MRFIDRLVDNLDASELWAQRNLADKPTRVH